MRLPAPRIPITVVVGAVALALVPAAAASHSFADVPDDHPFHAEIGIFKATNITSGCTATLFCPEEFVRRQGLAAFLDRALGLVVRPGENALRAVPGSRTAMVDDGTSLVRTNNGALELSHDGYRTLRIVGNPVDSFGGPAGRPNIIGGHAANDVRAGVVGATIAGGGDANWPNVVADHSGSVGGGWGNLAGDSAGTTVDRLGATVAGGYLNTASGRAATIPGGAYNAARGDASFAAGTRAQATHPGSFVWADMTGGAFGKTLESHADNSFTARAIGGVRFISAINATTGSPTAGVRLAAGGGAWESLSDRAAKRDFRAVDGQALLRKVARLPVTSWSYRSQRRSIRHLGPTAQDFRRAFGLGEGSRTITTVDADGVALAAVQALYARVRGLERENATLRRDRIRLAALERAVIRLTARP